MPSAMMLSLPAICWPFKPRSLSIRTKQRSLKRDRPAGEFEHASGVQASNAVFSESLSNVGNCYSLWRRGGGRACLKRSSFASAIIKFIMMAANSKRFIEMRLAFLSKDGIINLSIV